MSPMTLLDVDRISPTNDLFEIDMSKPAPYPITDLSSSPGVLSTDSGDLTTTSCAICVPCALIRDDSYSFIHAHSPLRFRVVDFLQRRLRCLDFHNSPAPRLDHVAFSLSPTRLAVFGGKPSLFSTEVVEDTTFFLFDTVNRVWTVSAGVLSPRHFPNFAGVLNANSLILFGGTLLSHATCPFRVAF